MFRLSLIAGLPTFVVACAGGSAPADLAVWEVDPAPAFDSRNGRTPEDSYVEYAIGATTFSNGNVAIADMYAANVHIADSAGRLLRSVGRRGDGPGEFRDIRGIMQCAPDSLFVWDYRSALVTVLDSSGSFIHQFKPNGRPHALQCSRGGILAGMAMPTIAPTALGSVDPIPTQMWTSNVNGDSLYTVGVVSLGHNRLLGSMTHFTVSSDKLYVGTADSAWIDVYSLGGRPLQALHVNVFPRTPSQNNIERAADRMVSVIANSTSRQSAREMLLSSSIAETLPPYQGLFIDPAGRLWVVLSAPGDPQTELRVLNGDGVELADVILPVEMNILEISSDRILGVVEDATGQYVVGYRYSDGR